MLKEAYTLKCAWALARKHDARWLRSPCTLRFHITGTRTFDNPLGQPQGATYAAGTNQQVGMMFPYWHCQMVADGLSRQQAEVPVTLARSGW